MQNDNQTNDDSITDKKDTVPLPLSLSNDRKIIAPTTEFIQELQTQPATSTKPNQLISPSVVSSIYPEPATSSKNLATDELADNNNSSDLFTVKQKKKTLPIGIYVIVVLNLIGFVVSFFDSSQNSVVYTIVRLVYLLFAIGLLLRLEIARRLMVWLSGLALIIAVVGMIMLFSVKQQLATLKTNYEASMSHIDQTKLTDTQKQQIQQLKAMAADKERQAGNTVSFSFLMLGATSLETVVIMAYLSRPKIKEAFKKLDS